MFGELSGEAERTGSLMALLSRHPPMPGPASGPAIMGNNAFASSLRGIFGPAMSPLSFLIFVL